MRDVEPFHGPDQIPCARIMPWGPALCNFHSILHAEVSFQGPILSPSSPAPQDCALGAYATSAQSHTLGLGPKLHGMPNLTYRATSHGAPHKPMGSSMCQIRLWGLDLACGQGVEDPCSS